MYSICAQDPWKAVSSFRTRRRIQPECVPFWATPRTAEEACLQTLSLALNEYCRHSLSRSQASAQVSREGGNFPGKSMTLGDLLSQSASSERVSLWTNRR